MSDVNPKYPPVQPVLSIQPSTNAPTEPIAAESVGKEMIVKCNTTVSIVLTGTMRMITEDASKSYDAKFWQDELTDSIGEDSTYMMAYVLKNLNVEGEFVKIEVLSARPDIDS